MKTPTRIIVPSKVCLAVALLSSATLTVHAQDLWTGSAGGSWTNGGDWQAGTTPLPYDSLVFQGGTVANNNDFSANTAFDGLTFASGSGNFNLVGNSVLLSGNFSGVSNGVFNGSGTLQTVTLGLGMDWGYYTFSGSTGGLALGSLSRNAGSAAYFDATVTLSGSTTDSSGLISGFGGAALMYGTSIYGTTVPTGLATVSGGTIVPYSSSPGNMIGALGVIPSGAGNNIELTTTGAATTNTLAGGAGNTFASTIKVDQAGGANNSDFTTTVTNTGILALGTNNNGSGPYIGGIYVLNSLGTNHADFTLGGGRLTAGPMSGTATPGTIVVAVNGTNANNQASINSIIQDNASGGAVSVITAGSGSVVFPAANTYTGGTYITQGQLQVGNASTGAGTGPIYISSNANIFFQSTGSGTIANNLFVSPGPGSPSGVVIEPNPFLGPGAVAYAGASTFSGTITLLGSPVPTDINGIPTAMGNQFSCQAAATPTITGQITGTGTLEFGGAHSSTIKFNNTAHAANNWQGGLVANAPSGHAVNIDFVMSAANQIPSGPNAGNVVLYGPKMAMFCRFDLNGTSQTINGLVGSSPDGVNNGPNQIANFSTPGAPSILTLGANNATASFTGSSVDTATNSLGIVKIGAGTQTFDAPTLTFGYHGPTTVKGGTLALTRNAAIPNSPAITLWSGATLDASGLTSAGLTVSGQVLAGTGSLVGFTTLTNCTVITTNPATGAIGSLNLNTANGVVTMAGGTTFIWDVNDATAGAAGADPGWSELTVGGVNDNAGILNIVSTPFNPIIIKVTSLNGSDAPGNAVFNLSANQSWLLMRATNIIFDGGAGSFSPGRFQVDPSAFANAPGSAGQFSVALSGTTDLILQYTTTPVITTQLVNQTNLAGSTVSFTVGAAGTGITYQWNQNGSVLVNGGTSTGGAAVTISTNGLNSTLTLAGVTGQDAGGISVSVTNAAAGTGTSSATLTVIIAPSGASTTDSQSGNSPYGNVTTPPVYQGAAIVLSASPTFGPYGNTGTVTNQWYLNGVAIPGATNGIYVVNLTSGLSGTYSVVIGNEAGAVTNSFPAVSVPDNLSVVPNQMIFEPFNYPGFNPARAGAAPWTALNLTNNFNQLTGAPLAWIQTGTKIDFISRVPDELVDPATAGFAGPAQDLATDQYPVEGLASGFTWQGPLSPIINGTQSFGDFGWGYNPGGAHDSDNPTCEGLPGADTATYCTSAVNGNQVNLPLGGTFTNGSVYCSMVVVNSSFSATVLSSDYWCGFGAGDTGLANIAYGLFLQGLTGAAPIPYNIGIFKGAVTPSTLSPGVNGAWTPSPLFANKINFVVFRVNLNPAGNSTCDLWVNPPASSYYAGEGSLPPADISNAAGGAADAPGGISFFYMKITTFPVSRDLTDLRVGRTWASVTPPSAPTLSVNNNVLQPAVPNQTAVFTVQNAGNPVTGNYQWTFNNGSGPVAINAGSNPNPANPTDGAVITVGGTSNRVLTITGATAAEVGAYTAVGTNLSVAPIDSPILGFSPLTLTGSGSGTLTFLRPTLNIVGNGANVTLSWAANPPGFLLEQTPSLNPASWTTIPSGNYSVVGTNNIYTTTPGTAMYYQLISPP